MNRRDFLKIVGITTATSTAALYGCGSKEGSSEGSKVLGPIPTDKMTYRSFPGLGSDKVSILQYFVKFHAASAANPNISFTIS